MLCCALLIATIALPRRAWRLLTGQRTTDESGFAPPAIRPAPGQAFNPRPARSIASAMDREPGGGFLAPAAVTLLVYVLAVAAGIAGGAMASSTTPAGWALRTVTFGFAFAALFIAARRLTWRMRVEPLVVAGFMWMFVGFVDMHGFGTFTLWSNAPLWDMVFHGSGAVLATVGVGLAFRAQCAVSSNNPKAQVLGAV